MVRESQPLNPSTRLHFMAFAWNSALFPRIFESFYLPVVYCCRSTEKYLFIRLPKWGDESCTLTETENTFPTYLTKLYIARALSWSSKVSINSPFLLWRLEKKPSKHDPPDMQIYLFSSNAEIIICGFAADIFDTRSTIEARREAGLIFRTRLRPNSASTWRMLSWHGRYEQPLMQERNSIFVTPQNSNSNSKLCMVIDVLELSACVELGQW